MKKDHHIRIRISESQLKMLTNRLIEEKLNKSTLIREILDDYLDNSCRKIDKNSLNG